MLGALESPIEQSPIAISPNDLIIYVHRNRPLRGQLSVLIQSYTIRLYYLPCCHLVLLLYHPSRFVHLFPVTVFFSVHGMVTNFLVTYRGR